MRRFSDLLKRFRRDESGAFLVLFAIIAIVLIATSGAVVDFTYIQTARSRAQNALDAAALALQTQMTTLTTAQIKTKAAAMMNERIADSAITAQVNSATPDTTNGKLTLQAQVQVPTAFIQLVGIKTITAQLTSEATKGSKNLEVSASLDITGSMAGTKISDLISATNTLIDLVVQTSQTPTYSKMAIVPWAFAVNVGSWANSVRGTPLPGVTVQSASWMSGSAETISAINTNNNASLTTSNANGFSTGDYIWISGITGGWEMTGLNNKIYKVGSISTAKKFRLMNTDGTSVNTNGWNSFSTSGSPTVAKCINASCQVLVTTSAAHSLSTGNTAYIVNASGMTALNGLHVGTVGTVPTTTSYYLTDETASTVGFSSYTANSATSYCTYYSCTLLYFQNASGGHNLYEVNNCATERSTNAYTDDAPSTTYLGFDYTSNGDACVDQVIQPLTTNKTTLHALANSLTATGSTAGHLGLAWGWYMISPNFSYLWPTASQPAAYTGANLIKAVILMTDGDFNSAYCNGVIAADSGSGSGSSSTHINCDATNGSSLSQAGTLCANIKGMQNTTLYTVGFDLGSNTSALNFLQSCASDPSDFFRADTGTDLTNAFKSIAQNLNSLRLSK